MAQGSIGFDGEIEVVPSEPGVVRTRDDVIAAGMDGDGADPFRRRHQFLREHLLDEVVHSHGPLGGDEEERLGRMEGHRLDETFGPLEGALRPRAGYLVEQDGPRGALRVQRGEVIAFSVPTHRRHLGGQRRKESR